MRFGNGTIFLPARGFVPGGFAVEAGRFTRVWEGDDGPCDRDLAGACVIPGLIDLHIHGAVGADFSDADLAGLTRMAAFLASQGVTGFVPTSMSLSYEALADAFATEKALAEDRPAGCARPLGVHMEGPFFSAEKCGAQNPAYLRDPDPAVFRRLGEASGGRIRIADAAPELPGAAAFAEEASKTCVVSAAHTAAGYDQAAAFFRAGATHLTHLFNAMPPLLHREPGVIGAAAEREDVTAELICDGIHVHPSAVRAAFRLFPGRICLISDAMRACGMPDGTYDLGGQTVYKRGPEARLADGTIAGAVSTLYDNLRNAFAFGIPAYEAVTAATLTPARVLGCEDLVGQIAPGCLADFVICRENLSRLEVWMGGEQIV